MATAQVQEPEADNAVLRRALIEPEAFAELFDRYADDVYRYAVRRLGPDAASDVMAETFTVAFARRGLFDLSRADARPWLLGTATSLIRGQRPAELRRWRAMARAADAGGEQPDGDRVAARWAARGRSAAGLALLSPDQRDALLLQAWTELNYEQIAEALGVPVGTVRSRLHRARVLLGGAVPQADPPAADEETSDELTLLRELDVDAPPLTPQVREAARARLEREIAGPPAPGSPPGPWNARRTALLLVALIIGGVLVVVGLDVVA